MDRTYILSEIKRTAEQNNGKPLGQQRFETETGIKPHVWGKFWARFGDALTEAGFAPNLWQAAHDESYVMLRFAELARELGRVPTTREIVVKRTSDATFPSLRAFKAPKTKLVKRLINFCTDNIEFDDVANLCHEINATGTDVEVDAIAKSVPTPDGFVYLIKSGRFYKIGKTNHAGRRERELTIQLPEQVKTVHVIKTDDPNGIEAYWHKRFEGKRKGGEWFELGADDVSAFRRRKFM